MIYRYASDSPPMGHMTLKSSPFCPNGGKLTSQYLVVDHMVAHYKKLKNVRSYVDTSPPKTWISSQKMRDRIMREVLKTGVLKPEWLLQSPLRPKARRPSIPSSEFDRSDMLLQMQSLALADDAMDEFDGTITSPMQKTHPQNGRTRSARQYSETLGGERERSRSSAREYGRTSGERRLSERTKTKYLDDSDLMETHRQVFTEGKAFTPRTLKTNMSSKLAENSCYNPPRRKAKSAKSAQPEDAVDQGTMKSTGGGETARFNDTLLTLRSYDSRDYPTPSDVPPLNISQDLDNQLWLKEQQSRRIQEKQVQVIPPEPTVIPSKARKPATPPVDRTSPVHEKRPIPASDEELLYLNFMTDVTADILNRGTFTNRALKQVFESHIAKHQGDLKLSKMQEMIKELGTKLGIPETDEEEGFGFTSTKRLTPAADLSGQSTNSSLLMTRQTFDPKQLLRSVHRGSRGSGLTTNTQPVLYDVQEVQEDDLSGESGRTGKTKIMTRQQGVDGRSYDELSVAGDSFRSVESTSIGFDELDYRILGTTQVLPPEKVVGGNRPGESRGQGHLLEENTNREMETSGRVSPERKKQRSPGHKEAAGEQQQQQQPLTGVQGQDSAEVDPLTSPRHGHGQRSPDATGFQKELVENSAQEDFESKGKNDSGVKTRSAKSSPQPKSPPKTPKIEDNDKKTSSMNDADAGESSRANDDVTGNFDDESSLLDTLGEYKHSLEVTDNYDDYDDDYESPPQSLPRQNNNDDDGF